MHEKMINATSRMIQNNKEPLLAFLKEKVGPVSLNALQQDEVIRLLVARIHSGLPLPFRFAVREKTFVNFFMSNKDRAIRILSPLFDKNEVAATEEGYEESTREKTAHEHLENLKTQMRAINLL